MWAEPQGSTCLLCVVQSWPLEKCWQRWPSVRWQLAGTLATSLRVRQHWKSVLLLKAIFVGWLSREGNPRYYGKARIVRWSLHLALWFEFGVTNSLIYLHWPWSTIMWLGKHTHTYKHSVYVCVCVFSQTCCLIWKYNSLYGTQIRLALPKRAMTS